MNLLLNMAFSMDCEVREICLAAASMMIDLTNNREKVCTITRVLSYYLPESSVDTKGTVPELPCFLGTLLL